MLDDLQVAPGDWALAGHVEDRYVAPLVRLPGEPRWRAPLPHRRAVTTVGTRSSDVTASANSRYFYVKNSLAGTVTSFRVGGPSSQTARSLSEGFACCAAESFTREAFGR